MADPAPDAIQTVHSGLGRTAGRVVVGERAGRERFEIDRRPLPGKAAFGGGEQVLPARVGSNNLAQARNHLRLLSDAERPRPHCAEPGARIDHRDFDFSGIGPGLLALREHMTYFICHMKYVIWHMKYLSWPSISLRSKESFLYPRRPSLWWATRRRLRECGAHGRRN